MDIVLNQAAISKPHGLGTVNNGHLFSHGSREWRSEIRGPADLVPSKNVIPVLQMASCLPAATLDGGQRVRSGVFFCL